MLARYILCDGPVLVRLSVQLGAEGPRDAYSCRETGVATLSYMRPIATDVQQWRGRSIHAAYCYRRAAVVWSVHPGGLLLQTCSSGVVSTSTRPIATDAQLWRGRFIHAAYCCRRTAVAWSVHPRGLLLQTRSSGVVSTSRRPIAADAQQWRGQYIHAAYCYRHTAVAWSVHPRGLLLQTRSCCVVWQSTRLIATGAVVEQPGGQRAFLVVFSVVTMTVFGISIAHYVLSQQCRDH